MNRFNMYLEITFCRKCRGAYNARTLSFMCESSRNKKLEQRVFPRRVYSRLCLFLRLVREWEREINKK